MQVRALIACCILLASFITHAIPYWIWHKDPDNTNAIRRTFPIARDLNIRTAPLRFVADAATVELRINDRHVAIAEMFGPVIELDAKPFLKPGRNEIELRPIRTQTNPAVALDLKVNDATTTAARFVTAAGWHGMDNLGDIALERWWNLPPLHIGESDDYTQWKRASNASEGTDPATFQLLPGFKAERLISAGPDDGSWVSLAFDPRGRLTIGREDQGLIRYTFNDQHKRIARSETLKIRLKECRGQVYAHDSLFVHANQSKGIYRLRDTNGDGAFDEQKLIYQSEGGFGHGRNALTLGPDGKIYAIHGDSIQLPAEARDLTSPVRRQFKPFRLNEGHVLRMNADGSEKEIFAAGLRNPYGIAFNADGEAFTYDADAEYDMGTPWYRPTEVKHLTSGSDFGWRAVTGSWPPYYPDHFEHTQACVVIGKGSPTGVRFGTNSHFPPDYQKAMYALDWTYGRILAIHLRPRGATYMGNAEVFLRGLPLNLTDLTFGPDGAMYFTTGGRKTQSALYRISYQGPATQARVPTMAERNRAAATKAYRAKRRIAEIYHTKKDKFETRLNTTEPRIRHAWRIALEHNPSASLTNRSYDLEQLTAQSNLNRNANYLPLNPNWHDLLPSEQMAYIDLVGRILERRAWPKELKDKATANLAPHFPDASTDLNLALAPIMIRLTPHRAVPQTMQLLESSTNQRERIHYLHHLRNAKTGWTKEARQSFFQVLNEYDTFLGGRGLPFALRQIRKDTMASLTQQEKQDLANVLNEKPKLPPLPDLSGRKPVKAWSTSDFLDMDLDPKKRNLANGKKMFHLAMCSRCHRKAQEGYPIGPDLTQVGDRFAPKTLLEEILEPSKTIAENYHTIILKLKDEHSLAGQVIPNLDYREPTLQLAENPLHPDKITRVNKSDIVEQTRSETSIMPPGLTNILTRNEVLDLVAWLLSSDRNR